MPKLTFLHLRRALEQKGFIQIGTGGHPKYLFMMDGKATGMPIVVRSGRDELTKGWKADLTKRLRMPDQQYLEAFVDCSVSGQDYKEHLSSQGAF